MTLDGSIFTNVMFRITDYKIVKIDCVTGMFIDWKKYLNTALEWAVAVICRCSRQHLHSPMPSRHCLGPRGPSGPHQSTVPWGGVGPQSRGWKFILISTRIIMYCDAHASVNKLGYLWLKQRLVVSSVAKIIYEYQYWLHLESTP